MADDPYGFLTRSVGVPESAEQPRTVVWLARHGEAHNPAQVLYARLPRVRLSSEGERQAAAIADLLSTHWMAAIYSSPMLRTRRTAARIAAAQPPPPPRVRLDSDLLEIGTSWQGANVNELVAINWELYDQPRAPGGEQIADIRDRMRRWLDRVLRRHAGQEVLGVSHGDPILVLLADLRGDPMATESIRCVPYIPTGCVFELQFGAQSRAYLGGRLHVPHAPTGDQASA